MFYLLEKKKLRIEPSLLSFSLGVQDFHFSLWLSVCREGRPQSQNLTEQDN